MAQMLQSIDEKINRLIEKKEPQKPKQKEKNK